MPRKRKRNGKRTRSEVGDPLEAYRRVRKPIPPPGRVDRDRRRELQEQHARREATEDADEMEDR
jgi:hypothetical protein